MECNVEEESARREARAIVEASQAAALVSACTRARKNASVGERHSNESGR